MARTSVIGAKSLVREAWRSTACLCWSLLALSSGASALAQSSPIAASPPPQAASDPSVDTVQPLTVIGRRPRESPRTQAFDFVRAHGAPTTVLGQLARWR